MKHWDVYRDHLDRYREELDNENYEVQEDVLDLEMKLNEEIQLRYDAEEAAPYEKVLRELKTLKEEFNPPFPTITNLIFESQNRCLYRLCPTN